jgi:outer membrane lipoprotein-sorting protein
MGKSRRLQPVAVALLLSFVLSSCSSLWRTPRAIFRGHKRVNGAGPALKVATRDELIAIVASIYKAVGSFQASSVELTVSQGSVYAGKIDDWKAFPGYIFFRKPDNIRIRATIPVVGTLALDMFSDGASFRVLAPQKNLLVEGLNSAPANSPNKMENLRPDAFLSSMLIRPIDPARELVMLKDDTDEDNALYRLESNVKATDGTLVPNREIWFDRQDLSIERQKVYDEKGNIISDTSYSKWQTYNGVLFPAHIDINRRMDGIGVAIEFLKLSMNKEVTDDKFELPAAETAGFTPKVLK